MRYGVLGPLEVANGSVEIPLNQSKQRVLLATLLIHANQVVSNDRLLENLWGSEQPASGLKALQYHVSILRDALAPGRKGSDATVLKTRAPGYILEVEDDELDAQQFARLTDEAREKLANDPEQAKRLLDQADALWRGSAFVDFQFHDFAQSESLRLEEERLVAMEMGFEAELALNRHQDAIPRLTSAVAEHPYREALRGLLITALYRAGRQAEALSTYQDMRNLLGEELGIDPSPELAALEQQVLLQGSSLSAPSGTSRPDVSGTNLPAHLSSFVGRVAELASVAQLTRTHRLVTLTGAGGAGKTRVAIEVAHEVLGERADGVAFVDLAVVREPDLVVQAVFDAVGADELPNRSLREDLTSHLADQDVLLVLDNCEHVVGAAASISAHLVGETTGVSILATSQHTLRIPGERVFDMPPLSGADCDDSAAILQADAGKLFLDRAKGARPGFVASEADAALIAEVTTQLGGIPLAIELAAARMRMMSLADIAEHLSSRFRLLTDGSGLVGRQETLEAALAWSYELTQAREQRFFDQLSVFAGSLTHEAAAAVCLQDDPVEVFEILGRLVDKSLIGIDASGDEMRYRMLESMRLFGATKLADRGELDATSDRHATYYLDLVRDGDAVLSGPDQSEWQNRFRRATPDIRTSLEWLVQHRPDESLVAVRGLGRYWYRESANTEAMNWLHRALDAADPAPSADRAHALRWLAGLMHPAGLHDESVAATAKALAMAREVDDPVALAASLNAIGADFVSRGLLKEAITSFEEVVDVEKRADIRRSSTVLWNLGVCYLELGDLEGLEQTANRLRDVGDSQDSLDANTAADLLMCDVAIIRGEFAEARALAVSTRAEYTRSDSPTDVAEVLDRLAHLCVVEGDTAAALEHLANAAELRSDIDSQYEWAANLVQAQVALAMGNVPQARESLRGVLQVADDRRQPSILSKVFHEASRVAFMAGDPVSAANLAGAVQEVSRREGVTVPTTIVSESQELTEALASEMDSDELKAAINKGTAMEPAAGLDLVRRVLR